MVNRSWRELCEAIMVERDPQKLMLLVEQLNQTLAQRERDLNNAGNCPLIESC